MRTIGHLRMLDERHIPNPRLSETNTIYLFFFFFFLLSLTRPKSNQILRVVIDKQAQVSLDTRTLWEFSLSNFGAKAVVIGY